MGTISEIIIWIHPTGAIIPMGPAVPEVSIGSTKIIDTSSSILK
jgi:hypothetical protein